MVLSIDCFDSIDKFINLSALNDERENLPGACKVTIHVREDVYFETKRAIEYSLIDIKRYYSDPKIAANFYD